ncbi:MAG: hypothetical protein H0Z18_07395 [Thermococcus sp.]|uniref:hypothetical protein n=1 Tax=Thermococcus sp. TaxID=35749 RepID=UPI001DEA7BF7|nr:hypothetical protein [Thermococcus sp.]MBO8175065.1 hypothetical protein [Thermococcus sp.]
MEHLGNKELIGYYIILIRKRLPRTEIHKRVGKKAKDLGVPFGTAKTNYNIVIKTLQNARMIYKSGNYYRTTKRFSELLHGMADVWEEWRKE